MRRILVTGATGKVGSRFIERVLGDAGMGDVVIRALVHNRLPAKHERVEVVRGSIAERAVVRAAMEGVTHVVHCATCKETPDDVMDVTVKGLFWVLEEARLSETFRQFVLIGGDAAMGHFFYPHALPVTEAQKHSAYPGCYALSKVLEEVMVEQFGVQYGLNWCVLRAPWIMEKDDFKYTLSWGEDVFGGPRWRDLVGVELAEEYAAERAVPLMLDAEGAPLKRNFVHVSDLVEAMVVAIDQPKARQQTFNICMDEPVDYGLVAEYLEETRGMPAVEVKTGFASTWLDNAKAKFLLGWRPEVDLEEMIEAAWGYERGVEEARMVFYPG